MTTWLVLASLVVFAYGGSIQNEFLLDDALAVANKPMSSRYSTLPRFSQMRPHRPGAKWYPPLRA